MSNINILAPDNILLVIKRYLCKFILIKNTVNRFFFSSMLYLANNN